MVKLKKIKYEKRLRNDLQIISKIIEQNEKILDVGCGDGKLIYYLSRQKNVDCRGMEIKQTGVNLCLKKGLSVIQGDANYELDDYPDKSFSSVILSQTIQAMIYPERVLKNLVRIGNRAIVSFPNFGFWKVRKDFLINGKMPKNRMLPFEWYDTPNIHLCTYKDFSDFCEKKNIAVNNVIFLNENGERISSKFFRNVLSYQVIFCISKK
tara:strand:- start:56 stop:682 length:627 start_codon:yes stop_codon:yes gene_type:complete